MSLWDIYSSALLNLNFKANFKVGSASKLPDYDEKQQQQPTCLFKKHFLKLSLEKGMLKQVLIYYVICCLFLFKIIAF